MKIYLLLLMELLMNLSISSHSHYAVRAGPLSSITQPIRSRIETVEIFIKRNLNKGKLRTKLQMKGRREDENNLEVLLKTIKGKRVMEARLRRGLTLERAAKLLKLSTGFLSEIEQDKRKLNLDSLIQIARVYNFPISYFWANPGLEEVEIISTQDMTKRGKKELDKLLLRARDKSDVILELESMRESKPDFLKLPDFSSGSDAAIKVRKAVELDGGYVSRVVEILERFGIMVFFMESYKSRDKEENIRRADSHEEEDNKFGAITVHYRGRYAILISDVIRGEERREELLRGFYYALVDNKSRQQRPKEASRQEIEEEEIESFICHFLLPPEKISSSLPSYSKLEVVNLKCLKFYSGLQDESLVQHLVNLDYLGRTRSQDWIRKLRENEALQPTAQDYGETSSYYHSLMSSLKDQHLISCLRSGELINTYS